MELEWEPLPTPRHGYEREFVDLFHKLAVASGHKREQLMEWFVSASVPTFETIGAPRVGYDELADAWLVERVEKAGRLAELDAIRIDYHGYNVLELLPPHDGFPVYSNYKLSEHLDRYSFHAELLGDVAEALGTELCERVHMMQLPAEHAELAARLLDVATRYAADNALPEHVATIREPVFPEGSVERNGHVLFAAAKWCAYWSAHGHGLAVYF